MAAVKAVNLTYTAEAEEQQSFQLTMGIEATMAKRH